MKKFTLFIMMLVMCATTTFAQTAIASPDDVKPGKIYWFKNCWLSGYEGYSASLAYNADKGMIWCSSNIGVAEDPTDPIQQYAFVEYEGNLYMYSVGADKFVSYKNDGAHVRDIPENYVTISESTYGDTNYPWCMAFDGDKLIGMYFQDGYEYSGYLYCTGSNTANIIYSWQIYEVGDLANADELTSRLATAMTEGKKLQAEAADNLMYKVEEAEEFLSDINYTTDGGGQVQLQVTDPAAGNYIWCNEPEMSEGPIEQLIDGIVEDGNFFHSCWNGPVESVHWLQIDLETSIQNFSFTYYTRSPGIANDFPDAIEVQGSNNGETFETITVLNNDLPQMSGKKYESGTIYADKAYKHLRFVITAERTYFHMSEFEFYQAAYVTADENYMPYIKYLNDLANTTVAAREFWEANMDGTATVDEYNAYIEQIDELMELIKGLVSGEPDDKTKEYIAYLEEEVLALQGVGYPGEAPRAAYQALIDAAKANPTTQARLDLQEALKDYIKTEDIILPTGGEKYTLTFITYNGRRNFLNYEVFEEDATYALSMVNDTITTEGLPLPETAVFTCVDNEDGTFDFMTADGKYLTTPAQSATSGSATGIIEYPTCFTIVKMYPNGKCELDVTYDDLFGLVALNNGGTYMAPNSSGTTYYQGSLPHFMGSWTSAMAIEVWTPGDDTGIENVGIETVVEGIYDLQGRKVENPSTGIYIVNGKKVLVK